MKSYADDDELKLCFLLPIEDSDEEEVKGKLVKCESCQMMIKDCDMKNHLNTHNLTKPYECEFKGCFKRFNTEENLLLHKRYFHKEEISLNQKKINLLKEQIKDIPLNEENNNNINYNDNSKFGIGKYIYEDQNGNVIKEKMFISLEEERKDNNNVDNPDDKIILGFIANALP